MKVYRVPGNIHIANHAYSDIAEMLEAKGYKFDFTYKINHVSFGKREEFDYISKHFNDLYMEHPCDGIEGQAKYGDDGVTPTGYKTLFYLVAVPSYFEKRMHKYHVY